MKWLFYVVVIVYMFYRTVYGAKAPDNHISLDLDDIKDDTYIEIGEKKVISCKGSNKNQKLEWINPNGQVVPRLQSSRVFATQYYVQSMRSGPSLVLTFSRAAVKDSGVWVCKSGDVTEEVPICVIDPLSFEGTPAEVVADEGRSFTLSCQARGDPEPRISWYRNGDELTDDDKDDNRYRLSTKYNSKGLEGLLTVSSLTYKDGGIYTCSAVQESELVNGCSASETFNITLNINHAPTFGEEDAKEKVYAKEGETLFIKCEADGYPQPSYRWFKKQDEELTEFAQNDIVVSENGTSSLLQLKVTGDTYDKEYVCRATNTIDDEEKVFTILEPIKPETPSDLEVVESESGKRLMFNITWDNEILFDIDEIDAQYFRASQLKRRTKPIEIDWRRAKKTLALIGELEDYGILAILDDLEESTEYWVRLRVRNEVGETKWSEAIKGKTNAKEDNEDAKEEEGDIEVNTSSSSSSSEEEEAESNATEDDSLITTESPPPSDDTGNFYGLFFAVGIVLIVVACTFLMRMV